MRDRGLDAEWQRIIKWSKSNAPNDRLRAIRDAQVYLEEALPYVPERFKRRLDNGNKRDGLKRFDRLNSYVDKVIRIIANAKPDNARELKSKIHFANKRRNHFIHYEVSVSTEAASVVDMFFDVWIFLKSLGDEHSRSYSRKKNKVVTQNTAKQLESSSNGSGWPFLSRQQRISPEDWPPEWHKVLQFANSDSPNDRLRAVCDAHRLLAVRVEALDPVLCFENEDPFPVRCQRIAERCEVECPDKLYEAIDRRNKIIHSRQDPPRDIVQITIIQWYLRFWLSLSTLISSSALSEGIILDIPSELLDKDERNPKLWPDFERWLRQLYLAAYCNVEVDEKNIEFTIALGRFLDAKGYHAKSLEIRKCCYAKSLHNLGEQHTATVHSSLDLIGCLIDGGLLDEAEVLCVSLGETIDAHFPHHPEFSGALKIKNASLLSNKGRIEDARMLMEEALVVYREYFDSQDLPLMQAELGLLGFKSADMHPDEFASAVYEIHSKIVSVAGDQHLDALHSARVLITSFLAQGGSGVESAQKCFEKFAYIAGITVEPDHPDMLAYGFLQSDLLIQKDECVTAHKCALKVIDLAGERYGSLSYQYLGWVCNMVRICLCVGSQDSLRWVEEATSLAEQLLGHVHPITVKLKGHYGRFLAGDGQLKRAGLMLTSASDLARDVNGLSGDEVQAIISWHERFTAQKLEYEEARKTPSGLLSYMSTRHGENDARTLGAAYHLALSYLNFSKHDEAVGVAEKWYKVARESIGPWEDWTLLLHSLWGLALARTERFKVAQHVGEQSLRNCKGKKSKCSDLTRLRVMQNVVQIYCSQGRLSRAQALAKQAEKKSREIFGEEHQETVVTQFNLVGVLLKRGLYDKACELAGSAHNMAVQLWEPGYYLMASFNALMVESLIQVGDFDNAIGLAEDAVTVALNTLGPEHPDARRLMELHFWSLSKNPEGLRDYVGDIDFFAHGYHCTINSSYDAVSRTLTITYEPGGDV